MTPQRPDADMPWSSTGILLGTYLFCPKRLGRWHVVIGSFDARGHFIRRLRNYERQGGILPKGQMGRLSSIRREHVDYEPRFQGLKNEQIEAIVARDLGRSPGSARRSDWTAESGQRGQRGQAEIDIIVYDPDWYLEGQHSRQTHWKN